MFFNKNTKNLIRFCFLLNIYFYFVFFMLQLVKNIAKKIIMTYGVNNNSPAKGKTIIQKAPSRQGKVLKKVNDRTPESDNESFTDKKQSSLPPTAIRNNASFGGKQLLLSTGKGLRENPASDSNSACESDNESAVEIKTDWSEERKTLHKIMGRTLSKLTEYTPLGSPKNLIFEESWSYVVPKVLFEISLVKKPNAIKNCLPDKTLHGGVTYYENLQSKQKARDEHGHEIADSTLEDFHAWIQTPEGQSENPTMHTILNNYQEYNTRLGDDFHKNYHHFTNTYLEQNSNPNKRKLENVINNTKKIKKK